jgi:polar amino acid transport system substrate-binding protein
VRARGGGATRRALALAAAGLLVAAGLACTPDHERVATPVPTTTTAPPAAASTCTAPPEESVASYAPNGVTPEAAKAQTIRKDVLVAGVSADTYLTGFRDPNANIVGFDIEILREVARSLFGDPNKVELKVLTVDQRLPALQRGDVDIVAHSFTVTCARWEQINFSAEYLRAAQRLLVSTDDAAAERTTLDQFAGRKVCATKGGTGMDNLTKNYPKVIGVPAADRTDCLVMFQQGSVDAILNGDNLLAGFTAQDPYARVVGGPLTQEPTALGTKKGNTDLTRFVNGVLEEVKRRPSTGGLDDHSWQGMYDRWLKPALGPASPPPAVYGRTP